MIFKQQKFADSNNLLLLIYLFKDSHHMSNTEGQNDNNQFQNDTGDQNKRKRRPRNDDNNRDYICSCGKSYLSYPALYTHIKTKHDGKAPGIIQMPRTQKGSKLKKYNFKQERDQNEASEEDTSFSLTQMINFLNSLNIESNKYEIQEIFQKFTSEDKTPLLEAINQWQSKKVKQQLLENGAYNTTIDRVLAKFILSLMEKIDKQVLIQVIVILLIWRKSINKSYHMFEKQKYEIYSKQSSANNLIQVVNDLITVHFSEQEKYYCQFINNKSKLLAAPKKQYHLCKFVYIFAKWLFTQKYTNSKIKYNIQQQ